MPLFFALGTIDHFSEWCRDRLRAPAGIKFSELEKVCDHYFESRNSTKTSHKTYKTPWPGNHRVNIQNANGKAKPYQVNQVLQAIDKLIGSTGKKRSRADGHQ